MLVQAIGKAMQAPMSSATATSPRRAPSPASADSSPGATGPVPSAADRYDYILTKHYHVQCTRCKKFINVQGLDYNQDLDDKIAQLTGFRMENHDIVFSGLCPECQIKAAAEQGVEAGREQEKVQKPVKVKAAAKARKAKGTPA